MRRYKSKLFIILALIFLLGIGAWYIYFPYYSETEEALAVLDGTDNVIVTEKSFINFVPNIDSKKISTGLIIYPGARVSPKAYAPLAQAVASQGYLVVIVPMPLHLAVLGVNKASDVKRKYSYIENWGIAGHSLGGAMAAKYAKKNKEIDGLTLWASYPSSADDLSDWGRPVTSIFATEDRLATVEKITKSKNLLPPQTNFISIDGGNHAQFGYYGAQKGDGEASISRAGQQRQIIEYTLGFLREI